MQQGSAGEARTPAPGAADPDRGEEREGHADEQVLGPEHRRQAEQKAGEQPPTREERAASPSLAQRKARTAAGRVSIAGGSLNRAPVEWMKGG